MTVKLNVYYGFEIKAHFMFVQYEAEIEKNFA
jgi:hypothetical protein